MPQPFWAIVLALFGMVLALGVLFHRTDVNIALAVLGIGSNLVSGALGAFAGHANAESKNQITGNNPVVNQTPVLPQNLTNEDK